MILIIIFIIFIYIIPCKILKQIFPALVAPIFLLEYKYLPFYVTLLFLKLFTQKHIENFSEKIPLNIFQTWHSKELPPDMKKCVDDLKKQNPEFNHYLFDDNDCREYIEKNFDKRKLDAYDKIKPGAFKADLWRLCILLNKGGVYIDCKFKCADNVKLIELVEGEHLVKDRPNQFENGIGVYNAFIIVKPNNEYIKKCLDKAVENIEKNHYGFNPLYITGPGMMGEVYKDNPDNSPPLDMNVEFDPAINLMNIAYKDKLVIVPYPTYRKEFDSFKKTGHYDGMWRSKNVYN